MVEKIKYKKQIAFGGILLFWKAMINTSSLTKLMIR